MTQIRENLYTLIEQNFPNNTSGEITEPILRTTTMQIFDSAVSESNDMLKYSNETPIPVTIGGITSGSTFSNVNILTIIDNLLYPYQYPSFSNFTLSNRITQLECGENWIGSTLASWTYTNSSNISTNTLSILQDASYIYENISINSPITIVLISASKSIDAQYITMKIQAKNSLNELFSRQFNVTWYMPYYFGVGAKGLNVTNIQSLLKTVASKSNISKTYNTSNQVPYLAYAKSRGLLTSILDKNGYETISDFTITEKTFVINGISVLYYVYEFNNLSTATNLQITYKY